MKKPKVTIVGHVCIDHNTIDGVSYQKWGSSAAYISKYYLDQYGISPQIITSFGEDFLEFSDGLDILSKHNGHPTLLYENIVNDGHRVQYCRNSALSAPPALSKADIQALADTDILIIAPLLPNISADYIGGVMKHVRPSAIKALLPQGYTRKIYGNDKIEQQDFLDAAAILPYFDVTISSDEDHADALGIAPVWAAYKPGLSIVVTQAEKGATVFTHSGTTHIPTTPLPFSEIKNPVGSGDMFSAQLVLSLHNGLTISEATKEAHQKTAEMLLAEPLA